MSPLSFVSMIVDFAESSPTSYQTAPPRDKIVSNNERGTLQAGFEFVNRWLCTRDYGALTKPHSSRKRLFPHPSLPIPHSPLPTPHSLIFMLNTHPCLSCLKSKLS